MLHPPADRTTRIASALTLETVARAAALKAEGKPVLSLSVGEPDFDTPAPIREAGKYAIDHGITRYTEGRGTLALRKTIAAKLARDQHLDYTPEQILVSNGGKHVITNFLLAAINPGDEVILPAPYFLAYPELIKLAEGVPVILETEPRDRYLISPDATGQGDYAEDQADRADHAVESVLHGLHEGRDRRPRPGDAGLQRLDSVGRGLRASLV